MATEPEVHPATLRYLLAVPRVVQSISPALAALHVTRSRLVHHPNHAFDTTHCTACGSYLTGGSGSVRVMRKHATRKSSKPYRRIVRKSCDVCGQHQDVPIEEGDRPACAKVGKQQALTVPTVQSAPSSELVIAPEPPGAALKPSLLSATPTNPPRSSGPDSSKPKGQGTKPPDGRSKARAKKRSGLSDMLARNKERQEKERSTGGNTGLAAFLQNL